MLTDLDRRLAGLVVQQGVLTAEAAKTLEERAGAENKAFSRLVVADAGDKRDVVLSMLRALHAGFPATDEDALDRHEDRLAARLAVKVGIVDEAAARTALAGQDILREKGQAKRLGEILVELGKLDAPRADRLYRQLENAVLICHDCFSANPRGVVVAGAELECPRCGARSLVPPLVERPAAAPSPVPAFPAPPPKTVAPVPPPLVPGASKTPSGAAPVAAAPGMPAAKTPSGKVFTAKNVGASSTARVRAALAAPVSTESGEMLTSAAMMALESQLAPEGEKAAESAPRKLIPQKRRRPRLDGPGAPRDPRLVLGALAAVTLVLVVVIVVVALSNRSAARIAAWKQDAALAAKKKAAGDVAGAAALYAQADLDLQGSLPDEIKSDVEAARADRTACETLAAALAALDTDPRSLDSFVESTRERDLLLLACDALGASTAPNTLPALARLAASPDAQVRERACAVGLARGGEAALPALALRLASSDDVAARDAASKILAVKGKAALPFVEKALERFPKDGALAGAALDATADMPAAVSVVRRLAHSSSAPVAEKAIRLLAQRKDDAPAELVLGLDGAPDLKDACAAVLLAQGDKAVPALGAALAGGQATAAAPLLAIGSQAAQQAFRHGLISAGWDVKGAILEVAAERGEPPRWLRGAVSGLLDDVRAGIEGHDPGLTRAVLARVVAAARAFGLSDSAEDIAFELQFVDLRDRHAPALGHQTSLVEGDVTAGEGMGRLELRNNTELRLEVWARGPGRVLLRAVANGVAGNETPAGTYQIGLTCIDSPELCEVGEVTLEAGKLLAVEVGGSRPIAPAAPRPAPAETPKPSRKDPTAPAETDEERKKRTFEHGAEIEKIAADARRAVDERLKSEKPWAASAETVKATTHYRVTTDAGPQAAGACADALEAAFREFSAVLPPVRHRKKTWMDDTEGGVSWEQAYEVETAHYKIKTNVKPDYAKRWGRILEALADKFIDAFQYSGNDFNYRKNQIDLYRNQKEFMSREAEILGRMASKPNYIGGFYDPNSKRLVTFQGPWEGVDDATTLSIVAHEATHQFEDLVIHNMSNAPTFMIEGLATFFEGTAVREDEVIFGRISYMRLEGMKRAIRSGSYVHLADLVRTPHRDYTGFHYGHGWGLVHWMMFGPEAKKGRKLLQAYWDLCCTRKATAEDCRGSRSLRVSA